MAIGMASSAEPIDRKGISMVADAINHAVPNPQELDSSIEWLLKRDLIAEHDKKYSLTQTGKSVFDNAMRRSGRFAIWEQLEKVVKNYA